MLYKITIAIVRALLWLFNGKVHVTGKELLPQDQSYVIVAPHRSWLDPVLLAIAIYPQPIIVMAKQELFSYPIFGSFIKKLGAFPVNREKPGPSALKYPVGRLKEDKVSLIIFPTGTRYSQEMKGGAISIARLAKVPVVPMVYQGPLTFGKLITRQKMKVAVGQAIHLPQERISKDELAAYDQQIVQAFDKLDRDLDPTFVYLPPNKK